MKKIELDGKTFETFILSVLKQKASLSKQNLIVDADLTMNKKYSNNHFLFDAYAPEGFGEFDNPVVFEIKYSKYTDGAISSLNSFVKKIMSAGIPSATTVVFITNVELGSRVNNDFLSKTSEYRIITYDYNIVSEWIDQYPIDYANAAESYLLSSKIHKTVNIQETDFNSKSYNNINLLSKAITSNECFALVLGAGVSVDPGARSWNELLGYFEDELKKQGITHNKDLLCKKIGGSSIITAQLCKELYKNNNDFFWAIHQGLYERETGINNSFSIYQIAQIVKTCQHNHHFRVLTYNFDEYLEKYLDYLNVPYNTLYDDTCVLDDKVLIYHVHGFLPKVSAKSNLQSKYTKSIHLTEEDYNQLYNQPYSWPISSQLSFFRENTCLFVGCSLSDPNIRRLLELTNKDHRTHFAILTKDAMSPLDLAVASNHFARIGVEIIWVDSYSDVTMTLKNLLTKLTYSTVSP